MRRHRYRKEAGRNGTCECGYGRSEDVHAMMVWHKSSGIGFWYSGIVRDVDVTYRIRTRLGPATVWWPESTGLDVEDWQRIGNGVGVSLARAKEMCEEDREARE